MIRCFIPVAILISCSLYGQAPVITSFSPASGTVGTVITINGANFSTTPASDIVFFGGVRATVTGATTSALTVTVPDGATPQPISVTVNNLTGWSNKAFQTTFSGGSPGFIASSFGPDSNLATGLYPFAVCAVDLDGDGKPDLISPGNANTPSSLISYRRNTGTAGTPSFAPEVDLPAPANTFPFFMVTGDLDGDGRPDVIFTASTGSLCIYRNASSPGAIAFGTRQDYATGADPFSVAIGDLDGDGKPDIAVANSQSNSISIYRNISTVGSIAFAPRIDLTTSLSPQTVAIADLDGDGKPDLAVTDWLASAVSLYRNQSSPGVLSFSTRTDIATGPDEPFGLAVGDLDGDGKPDLLVTYNNPNEVFEASVSFSLLKNSSSPGSFAFGALQNYGSGDSYNPTIGDLNGDGKPDIVVPSLDNGILVYPNGSNPGTLTLGSPGKYYAPSGYFVAICDLDGDNIPDMAAADFTVSWITIFKNATRAPGIVSISTDSATTGRQITITGMNLGSVTSVSFGGVPAASFTIVSPFSIIAIVGAGATGNVTLTSPTGTASFSGFTYVPPSTITSISPVAAGRGVTVTIHGTNLGGTSAISFGGTPAASYSIVADSIVTAVVGTGASGDVVLANRADTAILPGAFTFIPAPVLTAFTPTTAARGATITITGTNLSGATAVTLGGTPVFSFTVNSANSITAVAGGGSTGSLSVTTPGGTDSLSGFSYLFQTAPVITSFSPVSGHIGTTVTLTGSGFDATPANDVVYFGAVRATVNSATATTLTVTVPAGASVQPISVTTLGNNLTAYSAAPFGVTFDGGAIQFAWATTIPFGENNHSVCAGDLDGDGKPDLVFGSDFTGYYDNNNVFVNSNSRVLRNTTSSIGAISFAPAADFNAGIPASRIAVLTDVDGDGKPDLAILAFDTVYVLRNTSTPGNISFDQVVSFRSGYNGQDLVAADLDGDGRPELITANTFSGAVSILRNTSVPGAISFAARTDFAAGNSPSAVAIGDFDGDGKKDVAVTCQTDNKVVVFANQSSPGKIVLGNPVSYAVGSNPTGIVAGDLDGDGKMDIAIGNSTDNSISILRNKSTSGGISFAPAVAYNIYFTVQVTSVGIVMADADGDGKLDLGLINWTKYQGGQATIFRNSSTPGNMAFTRVSQPPYGLDPIILGEPNNAIMEDLDGDGRPDLVTADIHMDQGVNILRNQSGEQALIYSFSPVSGSNTSTITITGKNFDSTTSVTFGGFPATSFTIVSSTVITAVPPVNSSGTISVTTNRGTASLDTFFYAAPPIVNQAIPINATTGSTVTLTGDNFLDATGVSFGGVPAASFTVVNSNTITAVVAAGASGGISVTTAFGTGTLSGFTYLPVPTITSFTPTAGGPGTVVTITGTNFSGASNVRFGGVEADTFTIVSPTVITAVVGAGTTGAVSVTNDGWSNNLPGFVFNPSVQISAMGPTTFCQGISVVLQSTINVGNQWYQNGTAITGAMADTLLVTTSGTYYDQLNFPNLSNPSSASIIVSVNPIPAMPVITPGAGNELISSASSGNQWYQDTLIAIPGQNGQMYMPMDSGFYSVKVSLAGCNSVFSDRYFYHLPVKVPDTTTAAGTVIAAPNPTVAGRTQVTFNFAGVTTLEIQVSDMMGHMVLFLPVFQSGGYVDLAALPRGVYLIRLQDSNGKVYGKAKIFKLN